MFIKRKAIPFLMIFSILLLSGCGDYVKIKEVNNIAIVGVRYSRNFTEVNEKGENVVILNPLQAISDTLLNITPEDRNFFNRFTSRLVGTLESEGFPILDIGKFKNNETYLSFKDDTNEIISFVPDGYRFLDVGHRDMAMKLCEELGVDAVASFDFDFIKMNEKIAFIIDAQRLGIRGVFRVVNKDGILIFNESFIVKAKDSEVKFSFTGGVSITPDTEKAYNQIADAFLDHLKSKIREAKKQAGMS